ncbi:MAG: DNA topoisomerase III, partial [Tenacibaculum sp.]
DKGSTTNLKGFKTDNGKIEALIRFDENFKLKLEPKKKEIPDTISCPKCKKGTVLKGKTAYGCSEYKSGCDFVFTFENIKLKANGQTLTKELVYKILQG